MKSFALLVGVSHFQHGLESLAYIEHDVNEMAFVLEQHLEVSEDNIFRLIDDCATTSSIQTVAEEIIQKAAQGDRVILYFATHGKTLYETPWLATYDAQDKDKGDTQGWLNFASLLGRFHQAQCNILGFLDSCQSTMFLARGVEETVHVNAYYQGQYSIVFSAAGVDEAAYPDREYEHGCWTYYLLTALAGKAPQAFSYGTNRITVNSLQEYLLQNVSHRVENTYGMKQTPHIWGTRAEDVVVNEYASKEKNALKIKDIYFGEIDADSERDSSPNQEFFAKNYYDLNSICETLLSGNAIQMIIGNKGTGKTFVGEYLGANHEQIIYQSVGAIPLADIKSISFTQSNQKGKYCGAWTYALYTILACCIVKDKKAGYEELAELLQQIYGEQYMLLLSNPVKRRNIMFRKHLKSGVRLSDKYGIYSEANGLTTISNLTILYEDLFNQYYSKERMYFLIDGLDDQLRGNMLAEQKASLLDLIEATQLSNSVLENIRFILMFRNDILNALNEEANLNKTVTARSRILSWLPTDGNKTKAPLYQFLQKRISTCADYNNKTNITLEQILPPKVGKKDTWDWIMELTTYTPRDVIAFFNICKTLTGEQECLLESNLWDATRPYADYLWREMTDVMNGTCLSGLGDELISMFSEIAYSHNINSQTTFSFEDFAIAYNANENLRAIPINIAMKILYEVGVMGIHLKDGKTYWYFRENPISYNDEQWRESTFDLHKGLWKKAHIW